MSLPPHDVLGAATVQHLAALPPADTLYAAVVRDSRPLPQSVVDVLEPVAQRMADPGRGAPPEALGIARASLALGFRFGSALFPDFDGDLSAASAQVAQLRLFDLPVPLRQPFLPFSLPDRAAHDNAWYCWYVGFALAVARSAQADHHVVRLRWTIDPQEWRRGLAEHQRVRGVQQERLVALAAAVVLSVGVERVADNGIGVAVLAVVLGVLFASRSRVGPALAAQLRSEKIDAQVSDEGYVRFLLPDAQRLPWSAFTYRSHTADGLVLGARLPDHSRPGFLLLPRRATAPAAWARLEELAREHVPEHPRAR